MSVPNNQKIHMNFFKKKQLKQRACKAEHFLVLVLAAIVELKMYDSGHQLVALFQFFS